MKLRPPMHLSFLRLAISFLATISSVNLSLSLPSIFFVAFSSSFFLACVFLQFTVTITYVIQTRVQSVKHDTYPSVELGNFKNRRHGDTILYSDTDRGTRHSIPINKYGKLDILKKVTIKHIHIPLMRPGLWSCIGLNYFKLNGLCFQFLVSYLVLLVSEALCGCFQMINDN